MEVYQDDRDATLALVTETLRDAGRTATPPEEEHDEWLSGEAQWSQPDKHGWMTFVPVNIQVWVPKALVALQMALQSGDPLKAAWLDNPQLSLARWPAVEAAARRLYAAGEI